MATVSLLSFFCLFAAAAQAFIVPFQVPLTPAQLVPPTPAGTERSTGFATVNFNTETNVVVIRGNFSLESSLLPLPNGAGLYGGPFGISGRSCFLFCFLVFCFFFFFGLVFFFAFPCFLLTFCTLSLERIVPMDAADSGQRVGTFSLTETLTEEDSGFLLSGLTFIQLNTEGFEQGSVRGQIAAINSLTFDVVMFVWSARTIPPPPPPKKKAKLERLQIA